MYELYNAPFGSILKRFNKKRLKEIRVLTRSQGCIFFLLA